MMSWPSPAFLLPLLVAHLAGDFLFQTAADVRRKHEWKILLKHGAIHAVATLILLGLWHFKALLAITGGALLHLGIDWLKIQLQNRRNASALPRAATLFFADQLLHLLVLLLAALYLQALGLPNSFWTNYLPTLWPKLLTLAAGLLTTIFVGGVVIGLLVKPFLDEIRKDLEGSELPGLKRAGQVIGWLERGLIVFFVLAGKPDAVGFLIAAKSIFRFGELKEAAARKEAEYIIIGTLMSFGWALVCAWLTARLL